MINSIKYFEEKSILVFEKLEGNFYRNPTDVASFVNGLAEELHHRGASYGQGSSGNHEPDIWRVSAIVYVCQPRRKSGVGTYRKICYNL